MFSGEYYWIDQFNKTNKCFKSCMFNIKINGGIFDDFLPIDRIWATLPARFHEYKIADLRCCKNVLLKRKINKLIVSLREFSL